MKKLIQQTYIILTVLLFMWPGSSVIAQCNHPDDYTALRALYLSTDGDNWTNKTGWPTRAQFLANPTPPSGTDLSGWYAVTCDGDRVQVLYLIENNLIGKIPVEIGSLTFVLHLSLFNNQLEGNIPVEIGNLNLLKYLSLANNQLIGNIPREFENLVSLEILSLTSNKITGNIPKEIGSLLKLNSLSLDYNQLSGNIPVEIKNLKKLNILNLDSNKLTGSIPKELGDLSELGILKLGSNQFTGIIPKELGMMTNLNLLWLYNNQLSGNIPKELGNLTNLVNLFLYDNQLTGNLPIELGKLYNLSSLQIYRNEISGNIPKELGNLTSLSILLLWSNNINGNIPKELGSLRNLTQLSLSDNKLTGDIPKELGNLNKLNHLSISNNKLSGRIPGELSSLNLYYLHLNNNNLDGCIDYQFKRLCDSIFVDDLNNPGELVKIKSNVNFLYNPKLSWKGDFALFCNSDGSQQPQIGAPCDNGNPADGTNDVIQDDCRCGLLPPCNHPDYAPIMELYNSTNGPNWINKTGWADGAAGTNCDPCNGWYGVKCENDRVKYIDLDGNVNFGGYQPIQPNGNNLTGYLYIGKMDSLIFLDLNFNKIGDTIPRYFFQNLKNLKSLSVAVNQITGIIPKEISEMNKIEKINLDINQISGFIPKEIGDLRSLKYLQLSVNRIVGTLPEEIGNLENLEYLSISSNKLTGKMPTEFKSLKKLVQIDLTENELSGEIPKELAELPKLKYLFLAYNKFIGNVHNNFFYSDSLKLFSAPYNNLSGCFNDTIFYKFCTNPNFTLNLSNNPLLPWQGDFSQFCSTDGSQQAQIGAPCDNGNPADGTNDVIQTDCSCGTMPPCFHPDFAPLMALYDSTNGPGWTNKAGWEAGKAGMSCDPCNFNGVPWFGVRLCDEFGRVVSLQLSGNQLTGTIPKELGNLQKLQYLNLQINKINKAIPKELGNLSNLKLLSLSHNQLKGPIIKELGNLQYLQLLDLQYNQIIGEIPKEIGNLQKLNDLYLDLNQLSGLIPKELGNLVGLRTLALGRNQLIGEIPKELGNLVELRSLSLGKNQLIGSIPKELGNLKRLLTLSIDNNQLIGPIPSELGNIKDLFFLVMHNNFLKGCFDPTLKMFCRDSVTVEEFPGIYRTYKMKIDVSNNPQLPWQGDFSKFCTTDGSLQAQIGASCDNGNPADGTNDVIDDQCNCVPCTTGFAAISGANEICEGSSTEFTATGGTSYLWSTGESTDKITVAAAGIYSVTVTDANGCTSSINKTLAVNNAPIATITGVSSVCQGESATFTASGGVSYIWSNGSTTTDITVNTAGTYSVTVTDAANCEARGERILTINANPTVAIIGADEICEGSTAEFTATGGTSFVWNTTATTDRINVYTAGTYTVTVTNANGCTSSINKTLAVNNAPIATITGVSSVCQDESATFTASGGISYLWSNGATTSDIMVNTAGTYSVTVTDANNCEAKGERILTINALPTSTIIGANEICEGSSTEFTATGGVSYVWNTTATTDKITVNTAGNYSVTVTDANGCTSENTKTLVVNNAPTATITGINAVCQGASTSFTAVGGTSYIWSNGATTADITVNTAGTYSVTVTDAANCEAKGDRILTINANPTAVIVGANEICQGDSTQLMVKLNNEEIYIYKIGDKGPAGGIVFYDKGNDNEGWRYLEVYALNNSSDYGTGCYCNVILNTSELVGKGLENSIIWNSQNCAGEFITGALNFNSNNFDDWFLPSKGELELVYRNLHLNGIGGFDPSPYWTSSPAIYGGCGIDGGAWVIDFSNGIHRSEYRAGFIGAGFARYVRRFRTKPNTYSYLWNTGATSKDIQINSGGIYTVSVTNNNGCVGNTSFRVTLLDDTMLSQTKNDTLYVDQGSSYQVDLLQNDILFTDSIKVQLVNIPQAFIRVLSFDEKGRISLEVKEAFIETLEIGYEVCDPCNPCVSGKLIILNEKLKEITQTTLITPSQSTNNTLQFSSEPIPDSELWIYNRWGQQIHHSKNYQNDWDASGYPGGVYYYVFKVYGFTIKQALTVVK